MTDPTSTPPHGATRRAVAHARTAHDVGRRVQGFHMATCERLGEYIAQIRAGGGTDDDLARVAQWFARTLQVAGLPVPSLIAPGQAPRPLAEELIKRLIDNG